MRIAVIGAGSMGCMLGGYLKEGGADVTLTVRRKELMDALNDKGLTIRMYEGEGSSVSNIPMAAVTDVGGLDTMDALLIMVKGPDTRNAMAGAKSLIGKDTKVITLQNGIGNTDIIKEFVPEERIFYGCLNMSATMDSPGVISGGLFGENNIFIGSITRGKEQKEFGEEICSLFKKGGITACYTDDIDTEVWYKLLMNVAVNASCGLVRLRGGEAGEDQQFMLLAMDMVKEAISVADAYGIKLDLGYFMANILPTARKTSGKHYPSMAHDMMVTQSQTEIDFINGAIERLGAGKGIPTPVNTTISRLVRVIQNNYQRQYVQKTKGSRPSFMIQITEKYCKGCGFCVKYCPKDVITMDDGRHQIAKVKDAGACIGCLSCATICPEAAISITRE